MLMMALNQEDLYSRLVDASSNGLLGQFIAHFVIAPREGNGALPLTLGLGEKGFDRLLEQHFRGIQSWLGCSYPVSTAIQERSDLRDELLSLRTDEIDELIALLDVYRQPEFDAAISRVMAVGCMGGDHLWRDLGFPDRNWLSDFIQLVYPDLKAKNDKDMKWKRFLYKQLCETGGNYVCRAPSCEECAAFDDCFGSED